MGNQFPSRSVNRSLEVLVMRAILACIVGGLLFSTAEASNRTTISLDGQWQVAEGGLDAPPTAFNHTVVVPGLLDMADPPFVEPGPKVAKRGQNAQKDPRRDAFWYRRTFNIDGPIAPVATLKVAKAMFGTRVLLNGQHLGDHLPSFTPGYFDAKPALRVGENELMVRVCADRDTVGPTVATGFDCEKARYIPGIFDSVELVLSGTPSIVNLQVAPDISRRQARVRVWLRNSSEGDLHIEVREAKSGRMAGKAVGRTTAAPESTLDLLVPLEACRLWSPEDPFLYELTARTSGDDFTTRFGMREFRFDPSTGKAVLNGQPYFMRGSNVTIYRFFEDAERGYLPWSEEWVRQLHRRVKDMHWNCLRYCIGFPPEMWYRIADEEGILIQDEFPIWYLEKKRGLWPKELKADGLSREYGEWMRERWNHPSVVIWDASNETDSDETVAAIRQVRGLDMSDRPWDNSYMPPTEPGDVLERHPYHFNKPMFRLHKLGSASGGPWKTPLGNAVVINEYGYLWLNRDGTPTTLTAQLYNDLLGPNSSVGQRRHLYARYMAAETEFWRSHRHAAAVVHFAVLGYARPDGQTSDHWLDVKNLVWEPEFYHYVRDAFAPVGLMIDAWDEEYQAGKPHDFPVAIINDLGATWSGAVRLRILRNGSVVSEKQLPAEVAGLGRSRVTFTADIPAEPADYQVEATLLSTPVGPVSSLRDFRVSAKTSE